MLSELSQHGHVIGGFLPGPWYPIDSTGGAHLLQGVGREDVIDAQTAIPAEGAHAVVPPRECALLLLEEAECVGESLVDHGRKGGSFGVGEQDLPGPGAGVMHVARFGGDVEIAHADEPLVGLYLISEIVTAGGEPVEFVGVLVGTDALAIGNIEIETG